MRPNNFDIVRLLLAVTVVLMHCYNLSQNPSLAPLGTFLNSRIAVEGFFAISGFLIFASYERTSSLKEYASNRALRILPGYWLSTLLCVVIAFCFGGFHVGGFLVGNLTFLNFLHPGVDGVFKANPDNDAMNGALWTIKIELMFYVCVPIIVWLCRRLQRDAVLIVCFALSVVYRIHFAESRTLSLQLPGQLSFFIVGALTFYHLPAFKRHGRWIMVFAGVGYLLHLWSGWFILRPVSVALLTMGACLLLPHIEGPARWGDFSYGTYVLHYPIVQSLVALGQFQRHPWLGVLEAVCLVGPLAAFSWFAVEKRTLGRSPYRRTRQAAIGSAPSYPPAVP